MGANPNDASNPKPLAATAASAAAVAVAHGEDSSNGIAATTAPSTTITNHNHEEESDPAKLHAQSESMLDSIAAEIKQTQDLTSIKYPVEALRDLYDAGSAFDRGVVYLATQYRYLRRVRGDGNCYPRAFLYSLCEHLQSQPEEQARILALVRNSLDEITKHGYERYTLETFHEEIVDLFERLPRLSSAELHTLLNEEGSTSEYCTWYLRMLMAAHLKADAMRFENFLELPYTDVTTFCQKEVEPMGRECDMVQVMALAEALGVRVVVEYLDGRDFDVKLTQHAFGPEAGASQTPQVTLLYRPGHYDILYKS